MNTTMVKISMAILMAVVLSVTLSSTWSATESQAQRGVELTGIYQAGALLGAKVYDRQGELLGKVDDLAIVPSGEIVYAIIRSGGFAWIGQSRTPVPLQAFYTDTAGKKLFLDVSRETLKKAPAFDVKRANVFDRRWLDDMHEFFLQESASFRHWNDTYARQASSAATPEPRAVGTGRFAQAQPQYARRIIGTSVQNRSDEWIGGVHDLVLDANQGKIVYVLIQIENIPDKNGQLAVAPWGVLDLIPQARAAILQADNETLTAEAYSPDELPNLSNRTYAEQLYKQYDREPYWTTYGYRGEGEPDSWTRDQRVLPPYERQPRRIFREPTGQESNPW